MMKEVVRALETGPLAEIGLIAFVVAFIGVVLYALTLSKRKREEAKQLPLEDDAVIEPRRSSASRNGRAVPAPEDRAHDPHAS